MTERHQQLLEFIATHINVNGFAPTRAEIARRFDWWPNAVQDALKSLQKSGVIRIRPRQARGIELVAP